MSMLKKFNNLFVGEDDFESEDTVVEERNSEQNEKKVEKEKPITKKTASGVMNKSNVALIEPLVFADSKDIIDDIRKNKVVIMNLNKLDVQTADRLLDFISGGIYAMDAKLKTIGDEIYLCVPNGVEVSGDFYEGEY